MTAHVESMVTLRRRGVSSARTTLRLVRNAVRLAFGRADYSRWESPGGLEEWWDERTQMLAELVPPGTRVIEFGAGRRQLERFLDPGCSYIPSDLSDRGPGTLVCDLNRQPLPDLKSLAPQVAVFGGVLEYLKDVPAIVHWLVRSGVQTCVLSFDAVPTDLTMEERLRELRRRLKNGYMNTLTKAELEKIFRQAGMLCVEERRWTHQSLYRFTRVQSFATPGQGSEYSRADRARG
jgi:hypothetical protein